MPVIAVTALWLATSAPTVPATENSEPPSVPAIAGRPPDEHSKKPKAGQPSAVTIKKPGSDNDEPGCEE